MRLTLTVWKQHIGKMTKNHWIVQGKRKIPKSDAEKVLSELGIPVTNINDVINDMKVVQRVKKDEMSEPIVLAEQLPEFNKNHPLYKERHCYVHKDNTVLLAGLDQAQVVAKAVKVGEGLPKVLEKRISELNVSDMHKLVQKSILSSHVFDAQQVKLPLLHDSDRPAWVFPRVYGISDKRRNYLLCEKLVHLCNTLSRKSSSLFAVNNSSCAVPLEKDGDLIQLELTLNMALLTSVPHEKFSEPEEDELVNEMILPDIYPLKPTITFEKTHFYESRNIFPVSSVSKFSNLHTIIIHHNATEVKNLHETPVQESQLLGRCLLYGFAAAVSQARQLFKDESNKLPFPICVQCIQTNGKIFDFSVFQLNTLNINGNEGTKNMFWMLPRMELFKLCDYKDGKPTLEGYNPEVFKTFMGFCTNH